MSLYGEYIKEREGKGIVEKDFGFMSYLINGQECYIEHVYVKPEFRRSKKASELLDEVIHTAKEEGCTFLTGSVQPSRKGATESLKAQLSVGFRIHSAVNDCIWLKRGI